MLHLLHHIVTSDWAAIRSTVSMTWHATTTMLTFGARHSLPAIIISPLA